VTTVLVQYALAHLSTVITVKSGDLLAEPGNIVVGFTDTFDTSTVNNLIIQKTNVQGKLLDRMYGGDTRRLDAALEAALSDVSIVKTELRFKKQNGKLNRYPMGTIVMVPQGDRTIFGMVYSEMGNDLVARSNESFLRTSLENLWRRVRAECADQTLSMPIVGSGLRRIQHLNNQQLIDLIRSSFESACRAEGTVCRELTIVIWEKDLKEFSLPPSQTNSQNA
jgi:hypothetical protein